MPPLRWVIPLLTFTAALPVHADRGALTVEAGGGGAATLLPSPAPAGFALTQSVSTPVTAATTSVALRYAPSNQLELALSGFYEPQVSVFHNGVTLDSTSPPISSFPGTLNHRYLRYGALAGARWYWGMVWRVSLGAEAGWARRTYSTLVHYDDRSATSADYRLSLEDHSVDSLLLSAGGGVEWAFSDKVSIGIQPRFHALLGNRVATAVSVPVVLSYSWYL